MKSTLTLLFLLISIVCISQNSKMKARTNYGPNFGVISDSKEFVNNTYAFGFSVRRIKSWRYIQPEVNLLWNSEKSEFSEMRVPILFGLRVFRTIRFNIGGELRSNLSFIGNSKRGLNTLTYESIPTYVSPIVGVGIDISRVSLDFRVSSQSKDLVDVKPQFNASISFLFGKRKGELKKL
jgi:hypothetical protein